MRVTPELLLEAYASGVFPMAESATSTKLRWIEPHERGIIPLDGLRVSRSLRRAVRTGGFEVAVDRDFAGTMRACAAPAPGREDTWINEEIHRAYNELHARGHAHSVECRIAGELVGGLYGVSLGAAFFGESMFSRVADASKVALVHLVARLRRGGYRLLDTQFVTPHLASLGAISVPRRRYLAMLADAIAREARFYLGPVDAGELLHSTSQTS